MDQLNNADTDAGEHVVFDPGLQPERTALAWRRTVLALLTGSLVSAKLVAPVLGWASMFLPAAFALAVVAALTLLHRHYLSTTRALTRTVPDGRTPDGTLPALTALMTLTLGAIAAWVLATVHLVHSNIQ